MGKTPEMPNGPARKYIESRAVMHEKEMVAKYGSRAYSMSIRLLNAMCQYIDQMGLSADDKINVIRAMSDSINSGFKVTHESMGMPKEFPTEDPTFDEGV